MLTGGLIERLAPFCLPGKCVVAGSTRRRNPEPRDLEIVCIPKVEMKQADFFSPPVPVRVPGFAKIVDEFEAIKGCAATGKYTQRIVGDTGRKVKLDLFMVTPENFGTQFAVRTGSDVFAHKVLAVGWVKKHLKSVDGFLRDHDGGGAVVPVYEERQLFELLQIKWLEPWERNL